METTYQVGYVWAENIGWIKLGSTPTNGSYANTSSTNWGVNRNSRTGVTADGWDVDAPVVSGGFPKSGLDTCMGKLVRAGHSVAIAVQDESKGRHLREWCASFFGKPMCRLPGLGKPVGGLV